MSFFSDPRRRSVALLGSGVVLFLALLASLNAFNNPGIRFLNPETSGETLIFTSLTVLVFLLLMALLMLLLRNILKIYADQSSSALGARLRTRMVLGAALIALTPAVFMFLFSFQLMNRSIDRWFSQPTSELREDSTRAVLELAHYVTKISPLCRTCWFRTASRWLAGLPWSMART
jgi:nitrogen fixation/metabolism regulation signal transduction histidine kinase